MKNVADARIVIFHRPWYEKYPKYLNEITRKAEILKVISNVLNKKNAIILPMFNL